MTFINITCIGPIMTCIAFMIIAFIAFIAFTVITFITYIDKIHKIGVNKIYVINKRMTVGGLWVSLVTIPCINIARITFIFMTCIAYIHIARIAVIPTIPYIIKINMVYILIIKVYHSNVCITCMSITCIPFVAYIHVTYIIK